MRFLWRFYLLQLARTFFFPAKYDWATGKAMYYDNGEWIVALNNRKAEEDREINNISNGKCILNVYNNTSTNRIKPEYSTHFTLAKFVAGKFQTLDYEYDPKFKNFPEKLNLEAGYYRLLTGNRANDGTVYIKTNYFNLQAGRTGDLFVELRDSSKSYC